MSVVFVSYRRADTQQAAGRLADRLIDRFGRDSVAIDVDTDQVGRDYRTLIAGHLERSGVVLVLIGPRFLAEEEGGLRRIDQPNDLVRLELARALERDVPVIPVLVDGALLPDHGQLPGDIADLVFRGSVELAHHRFDRDFDFLVERLERLFDAERESKEQAARLEADEEARREAEEAARLEAEKEAEEAARREAEEAVRLEAEKAAEEEARREAELARREAEEEAATAQRQAEETKHGEAAKVGTHQAVEAAGEAEQEPRGDLEEGRGSEAPSRWDRKRFGLVAVVVVLIAGLAAVVVVLATTGGDDTPSTTAAAPTVATDPGTATDPAAGTEPGAGTEPAVAGVDIAGTAVTVLGLQLDDHQMEAVREALTAHAIGQGIEVDYSGDPALGDVLAVRVAAGDPPDIVLLRSLREVAEYADSGWLVAVPDDVAGSVAGQWPADWMQLGSVDDTQYGIPTESGPKSLVYYKPARFAALGYDIPATWDELRVLTERAIADGQTPWCVGIESGEATGWVFTDWVEDLLLRSTGADFYDRWTAHDVPFNSPEVEAVWGEILELWNTPGAVYSGGTSIVAYPFFDNGFALAEDRCLMHRQAAFLADSFGPSAFSDGEIDVFYLPALDVEGRALLAYGTYAVALRDAPEVWAMVAYLGSAEYAEARQRSQASRVDGDVSGFLSANTRQDLGVYSPIEQKMVRILQEGQPMRFDASDLMPPEVGSGSFWVEGTKAVNGDVTVTAAVDAVEASWP